MTDISKLAEAGDLYAARQAELAQKAAIGRVQSAMALRDKTRAPEATGVVLKSANTGQEQHIFNDGSVRNRWSRTPGMSGRQFRKARKRAQRAWRAEQARAVGTPVASQLVEPETTNQE